MGKVSILVLSIEDILGLGVSMADCVRLCEETLRQEGLGNTAIAPSPPLHLGSEPPKLYLHGMPAYVGGLEAAGVKWVSHITGNAAHGLPDSSGIIILNDTRTGMPRCILEGMWVTYQRTAALTAVAAKYLARPAAETIGVVGAGALGRAAVLALREVLPGITTVKAVSRREASRRAYVDEMRKLVDYEIIPVPSVREAVIDADVIVSSATTFDAPLIRRAWLKPGALLAPLVGGSECEPACLTEADKLLVQHWPTFAAQAPKRGVDIASLSLYAELGEVVCGRKPGREAEGEIIVSINGGVGTTDMAIAQRLCQTARERGIGQTVSLC